jgi:TRAP-type C4-dicarboxylate transport system permease large subunit
LIALGCLIVFLVMAGLMATGRLSALLALPAMALAIGVVAGIPGQDILQIIVQEGVPKYGELMVTTMIGAVLAQVMTKFGIGARIVRWAAEFSGDSPYTVGVILLLVTAVLFSTMGGLGAVIMVGSVVLPVLMSVGIAPVVAGGLLVLGISLGGMFNLQNWAFFKDVLLVSQEEIRTFVLLFGPAFALVAVLFLFLKLDREQQERSLPMLGATLAFGALVVLGWANREALPALALPDYAARGAAWAGAFLLAASWIHRRTNPALAVPGYALLTPILPLILVLGFNMAIIPAFLVGIVHGVLSTWRPGQINAATQATFEGIQAVVPVLVLLMGIGMIVKAMMHPSVAAALEPTLKAVIPTNPLLYVALFGVLAPLSLYRGPLNRFGMGSGLAGLMLGTKLLPNQAIFGLFESVGQVQGVCDPTNTANVWVANFVGTSPTRLMLATLPWAWGAAVAGLCISAFKYLGGT